MLMAQLKHSVAHDKASLLHTNRQLHKTSNITPVLCLLITNYTMLYQLLKLSAIDCDMAETLRNVVRDELLHSLFDPTNIFSLHN
jgi:hypothetical protein